jgi:hypothetical protein
MDLVGFEPTTSSHAFSNADPPFYVKGQHLSKEKCIVQIPPVHLARGVCVWWRVHQNEISMIILRIQKYNIDNIEKKETDERRRRYRKNSIPIYTPIRRESH